MYNMSLGGYWIDLWSGWIYGPIIRHGALLLVACFGERRKEEEEAHLLGVFPV